MADAAEPKPVPTCCPLGPGGNPACARPRLGTRAASVCRNRPGCVVTADEGSAACRRRAVSAMFQDEQAALSHGRDGCRGRRRPPSRVGA